MPHDQPVISVESRDGHDFELIHVAAERPAHSMLFLPGMGLSARLSIRFARALAERGTSVFIHEWRGNGSSSVRASRRTNWGYRELLDDIEAARQAVAQRATDGYLIGGHSLGSQFACLSAAVDSRDCRGLVILAGGSPYWRVFPLPMKSVMITVMFAFPALGSLIGYYPGKRVGFAGNEARDVMADWARSARSGRYEPAGIDFDLEARLHALRLPLLALAMADDWFVPRGSLDWLVGKLDQCEVARRTVTAEKAGEKADHYAWMKQPKPAAEAIEAWLAEIDG
ncbi:MAG: alpha/beta fold hydrolase [Gammaproteobacteria bacterium]|jgi:predicted alpha/beta hydrolase|nr:alpha/beta fold hydrolase [Gammaproteobacteria bacterium]